MSEKDLLQEMVEANRKGDKERARDLTREYVDRKSLGMSVEAGMKALMGQALPGADVIIDTIKAVNDSIKYDTGKSILQHLNEYLSNPKNFKKQRVLPDYSPY